MAIPNERILTYMDNAVKISGEWVNELEKGVSAQRAHEIHRDSKLLNIVFKALSYEYAKNKLDKME